MNIGSGSGFPSANLSNFTPHPFVIDGVNSHARLEPVKIEQIGRF